MYTAIHISLYQDEFEVLNRLKCASMG